MILADIGAGTGLLIGLYFLPSALGCHHKNAAAIFVLNLLLGWTFVGWVIALVWAFTKPANTAVMKCPHCGREHWYPTNEGFAGGTCSRCGKVFYFDQPRPSATSVPASPVVPTKPSVLSVPAVTHSMACPHCGSVMRWQSDPITIRCANCQNDCKLR